MLSHATILRQQDLRGGHFFPGQAAVFLSASGSSLLKFFHPFLEWLPRWYFSPSVPEWYKEDVAFIHDAGFGDFARKSAPGILGALKQNKIATGLVVDLGCGSGVLAQELVRARYRVIGIDISEEMIRIARKRAPAAEFRIASVFEAEIPPCSAVTSIGECLNYLADPRNDGGALPRLFDRVYKVLDPGGVFIFDIAEPGQGGQGPATRWFSKGEGWVVLVEKEEDRRRRLLTRRITSFRQVGDQYRRSDEEHRLRLYKAAEVARDLRRAGFNVRILRSYGEFRLLGRRAAFLARKGK